MTAPLPCGRGRVSSAAVPQQLFMKKTPFRRRGKAFFVRAGWFASGRASRIRPESTDGNRTAAACSYRLHGISFSTRFV